MLFEPPFRLNSQEPLPPITPKVPRSNDGDIAALQAENERQLLIIEALWRIVRDKLGVDEQELVRQITILDMEDGRLDGRKASTPPKPCPACNRTLGKNRPRCLFCGEPIAADPFER
jgi:hypothetical protein